jgi:hypothetical protein
VSGPGAGEERGAEGGVGSADAELPREPGEPVDPGESGESGEPGDTGEPGETGETGEPEAAPLVIRRRGRRVTTEPPAGYTGEPARERQQSTENDERLRSDLPPHWGKR